MSDEWKSAVLLFILVLAATAFALLCKYLGLFVPRMNWASVVAHPSKTGFDDQAPSGQLRLRMGAGRWLPTRAACRISKAASTQHSLKRFCNQLQPT